MKKNFALSLLLAFAFFGLGKAQSPEALLRQGDSLYAQGQYTKALENYQTLLQQHLRYSPQMLLKLAYIHEGLDHLPKALYYLNRFYVEYPNQEVPQKLEKMAQLHELEGYQYSEDDFLLLLYARYFRYALWALIGLGVLLLGYLSFFRKAHKLGYSHVLLLLLIVGGYLLINQVQLYRKGILSNERVYLMEAPSAGAPVRDTLNAGHRLDIDGKDQIWYKVSWQNKSAYIHQSDLLVVEGS